MLARRRYLRRYPIQKFAGAQPPFNTSLLPEPVPRQRHRWQPLAHLRPAASPYRALTGKHRARTIAQQPLPPSSILRGDPHARMH